MLPQSWLLEFYVLATFTVMSGQTLTSDSALMVILYCPIGKSGQQHHDLITHLVTLSWHWANQSLSYPINSESARLEGDQYQFCRTLVCCGPFSNSQLLNVDYTDQHWTIYLRKWAKVKAMGLCNFNGRDISSSFRISRMCLSAKCCKGIATIVGRQNNRI